MRRRPWSWLAPTAGLLLVLMILIPLAHAAEGHGDECPACHFAPHAAFTAVSVSPVPAPVSTSLVEIDAAAPRVAAVCLGIRSPRGPPTTSR